MRRHNLLLLAAAVLIAVVPLFLSFEGNESFGGADGQAQAQIEQIAPDYRPWASPLWEPPSGEISSLLFALQAALGAGVLGYYFGLRRGQAHPRSRTATRTGTAGDAHG
ncbi:MAG: energy-coupling factor ABC transporter substrate-binding protein [Rhodospirillales bacterium]|nr:energy-coupling factor ABC transporter substrate-binding protein [Rhodospirillales bacterium]